MNIAFSGAVSANLDILQKTNEAFQVSQKRVSTGKKIFGAADDSARYRMSETMLIRSRQIGNVNNNISLALKTLGSVDNSLKSMIKLAESAKELAAKAQSEGADSIRSAQSTTNINSSTVVSAALVNGSRFSITSDGGGTSTFTFGASAATTTWNDVVNQINSANIGVVAEFVPTTTAGTTNLRFRSTNGKDFRFDGTSDTNAIAALGAITSPTGGTLAAATQFVTGAAVATVNQTGFTISSGGAVSTVGAAVTGATAVAINSMLAFKDGNGNARTISYAAASTINQVMIDINAMNAGIKAELVNTGAGTTVLRLRNTNGGNVEILGGSAAFAGAAGLARFTAATNGATTGTAASLSSNQALRLTYGQQYDAVITQMNNIIANVPVTTGRNLIAGNNMSVTMDEFAGAAITISGVNLTGAGSTNTSLGLTAGLGGTSWSSDAAIQASATAINGAITSLQGTQATFSTFNSYMKSRFDINASIAKDLEVDGNDLVAADVAEESAKLTALQTQQQFAVQAFSMGSQNQQALLRLLG